MVKRINCSFLTGKFLFLQTGNVQLKPTRYLRFTCWVLPTCGHHTKDCWPHGHTNSEPQGGLLVPPVLRHSRRKIIWLGTFLREMFWRMSMKSNYSGNERRETLIIWACVCCLKKITKVALKSLNHLQVKLKTPDIDPFLHSTICSTIGSENDICPMDPVRVHSTKAYIYVYIYCIYTLKRLQNMLDDVCSNCFHVARIKRPTHLATKRDWTTRCLQRLNSQGPKPF